MQYPEGFIENTARLTGNTQSGHQVVFGTLRDETVGIKPFTGSERVPGANRNKAEHEKRMYEVIGELGHQTLRPIRVEDGQNNFAFLITEFRPRLIPFSALDLTKSGNGEQQLVREMLQKLGELHSDGVTHGDAKLRNYSMDRLYLNDTVVVDLERAQDHPRKTPRALDYFQNARSNDISSLAYNLGQNGYGAFFSQDTDVKELFDGTVMESYIKEAPKVNRDTIDEALVAFQRGITKFKGVNNHYATNY